jgi:hypothetical protein
MEVTGMSETIKTWPPRLRYRGACDYLREVHGISFTPKTLANRCCEGSGPEVDYFDATPYLAPPKIDAWVKHRSSDTRRPKRLGRGVEPRAELQSA